MDEIFGPSVHVRQVESLSNVVTGLLTASVLAIHAIDQAYAQICRWNEMGTAAGDGLNREEKRQASRVSH